MTLPETNLDGTLILGFQPSELGETKLLLLGPLGVWCSVRAKRGEKYICQLNSGSRARPGSAPRECKLRHVFNFVRHQGNAR